MMRTDSRTIAVIGAGPVGAVSACLFAKRGFNVELYEMRADIRKAETVRGRSINLAISQRGRDALKEVGLEDYVINHGIPMLARMVHDNGILTPVPYGKENQKIYSIDRHRLNELLIQAAEEAPNTKIFFEHKLESCDFTKGEFTVSTADGNRVKRRADLIVGCDGAFSAVRRQIMKHTRFDYEQVYIPHGYLELSMPPKATGQFAMEMNYLHIWPRGDFMLIGLPNYVDFSFVLTLFMPFKIFESLSTPERVIAFFEEHFPDSIPLIGKENIERSFFDREPLPLVSIKCSPYHVGDKAVILGDAAHAQVPFYGQGMNAGLEDCLVLDQILRENHYNFDRTLELYTITRSPDAKAICDLAMYNYVEMRHLVNTPTFRLRKKLDHYLNTLMPNAWIPLYSMVSFTRIRYSDCIKYRNRQNMIIHVAMGTLLLASATYVGYRLWKISDVKLPLGTIKQEI